MGLLTFALNVTLDGCCDHRVGVVDDAGRAFLPSEQARAKNATVRTAVVFAMRRRDLSIGPELG